MGTKWGQKKGERYLPSFCFFDFFLFFLIWSRDLGRWMLNAGFDYSVVVVNAPIF